MRTRSKYCLTAGFLAAVTAACGSAQIPPNVPSSECSVEGRWLNDTPHVGQSTITVVRAPDDTLKATEDGTSNFDGAVKVSGRTFRIDFKTGAGYEGWYEWTLDDACNAGNGKLMFTAGGSGQYDSAVKRAPR